MPNRSVLLNAFLPATEIDDPDRFSGRRSEVRGLADALRITGSVPLIYGHRGLGKSSLARQMVRIAQGDTELLDHLGLSSLVFSEDDRWITFFVSCTNTTASLSDLLQMLINVVEGAADVADATRIANTVSDGRASRFRASVKLFEFETTREYRTVLARESFENLTLEEKLVRLATLVTATFQCPVLFVVDEIDRISDTRGLAGFLKAASSDDLKFLLVGIAGSHSELLADHESLSRQLVPVEVRQMPEDELTTIIDQAEAYLARNDIVASFSPRSRVRLAKLSGGFPWFVHVLGQSALLKVAEEGREEVLSGDISTALKDLIDTRFAQKYADQYQTAVRDSQQREITLRLFATWDSADIPTAVIYPMARNLGVSNPSLHKGHLCSITYGAPLYQPVFQSRGVVRFQDEMFKVYVRLRPSMYANVDLHVQEEYENLLRAGQ